MKAVYLVKGTRSPQVRAGANLKDVAPPFLAHYLIKDLLSWSQIPDDKVDEVIIGNVGNPAKYPNIGRVIALEAGLNKKTSGYTVHRNCASGMEALSQAYVKIASGRCDVIFAGGVENMSQAPLLFNDDMTKMFIDLNKAKTPGDKIGVFKNFRPSHFKPIIALEQGLTDPFCHMNMGMTAELLSREFEITRQMQDEFANESHRRATLATQQGYFNEEINPIIAGQKLDQILREDVGPRADSTLEKLAKLKPYFEKETGSVTVGNACPITDGGSMWLMCSEEAVKKYNLKPMARMLDFHFHGLEPERMGLGPVLAMDGVLKRTGMSLDQMNLIEINEAFAAQVLSCVKVMESEELCQRFGIERAIGKVDFEKLNVNGGAIALGHPVGSTGSRLVVTLAHELKRRKLKYGIASLCIGGGQGGATVIENLQF